jgi:glycerol uptake facilitator-like aquaporin
MMKKKKRDYRTMLLILFGNGVVANVLKGNKRFNPGWIVIKPDGYCQFLYRCSSGPVSGAHLKPIVTLD